MSLFFQHLSFDLLFLLNSTGKLLDLIGEQLPKEMAQFDKGELTCLILFERFENDLVFLLETWVNLSFDLVTLHEIPRKFTDLLHGNGAIIVGITGIVDIPSHILELLVIDENICQILDCLGVVNYDFWDNDIVLRVHLKMMVCLKNFFFGFIYYNSHEFFWN